MDLATLTSATTAIISNTNLIRINQDPKSPQATCFAGCSVHADWFILATTTSDGTTVVLVINWTEVALKLKPLEAYSVGVVPGPDEALEVRNLWTNEVVNFVDIGRTIPVPILQRHSCIVYELKTTRAQRQRVGAEVEIRVVD